MKLEKTAKDVRDYLNYLTELKKKTIPPINLEIDGALYHLNDGVGNRILTLSKQIYEVFQEL